jgi:hypothetical protein
MGITEKIEKPINEVKFPVLTAKNLKWKKSSEGYYITKILLKEPKGVYIEIEWDADDPEWINWSEKKRKKYYGKIIYSVRIEDFNKLLVKKDNNYFWSDPDDLHPRGQKISIDFMSVFDRLLFSQKST